MSPIKIPNLRNVVKFIFIVQFILTGCGNTGGKSLPFARSITVTTPHTEPPAQSAPTGTRGASFRLISPIEERALVNARIPGFERTLSMFVKVNSIATAPTGYRYASIRLEVTFRNESHSTIVFRKPSSVVYSGYEFGDIRITVIRENGAPVEPGPVIVDPRYIPIGPKDFLEIQPKHSVVDTYELALPWVQDASEAFVPLPVGEYWVVATYGNRKVGYRLDPDTPKPTLSPEEETSWYENQKIVVDLNAWVGLMTSNKVHFSLSEAAR